jgi:pseudaminic acid synthase
MNRLNTLWSHAQRPFIIAEMSGNHNQSLERALELVEVAARAGADAIKLQTFTPESMTIRSDRDEFFVQNKESLWYGKSLNDLYKLVQTPWEWHPLIMSKAKEHGLMCFSSPFDSAAVDFLESLNVEAYKIASFECIDLPLIRKVAQTGKPIIISTGMATIAEIADAVETARGNGCKQLILLKCTSSYPSSPENTHVKTIPHMKELFNCPVGLSDHTLGLGAAVAATALGAVLIEKHITLSRNDGGIDSAYSLEPDELVRLVIETERAWQSLGQVHYGPTPIEFAARSRRRSIYVVKDIKKGGLLTTDNIKSIRPGNGLSPKYWDQVLGMAIKEDVTAGTPLSWDMFKSA